MANPLKTSFSRTTDDLGRPQQPQLLHTELVNILRGYSRSKRTLVGASIVKRRSELGRDQPSLCIQRFHNAQESKHDLQCESNPLPCNCEPLSKIGWLLTWKLFQELESAVHWSDGYTMLIGLSLYVDLLIFHILMIPKVIPNVIVQLYVLPVIIFRRRFLLLSSYVWPAGFFQLLPLPFGTCLP